jgi:hypothetical protein
VAETDSDEVAAVLRDCEEALIELKESDRLLQDGHQAFAALASKMRAEIERRSGLDRRTGPRVTNDRRADGTKPA